MNGSLDQIISTGKTNNSRRSKRKRIKKNSNNYQPYYSYHHNPYQYIPHNQKQASNNNIINFKLADLFKPNQSLIDSLYAQVHSNSNKISLLYIPNYSKSNDQTLYNDHYRKLNILPLSSKTDSNYSINTNKLINEFYLSATNLDNKLPRSYSNSFEGVRMPRLLTSEIFLIGFVISLWLISILVCLKRYSLFICFHKRDVPFYNSSLINVSAKIVNEEFTNANTSRPMSPMSPVGQANQHQYHYQWNPVENPIESLKEPDCSLCSKSPSTSAILNKSVTQNTNYSPIASCEQNICKKCNKFKNIDQPLSNGFLNSKSSSSVNKTNKNLTLNSNKLNTVHKKNDEKNEFYFSNGILYPIKKHSSTMLHKVSSKSPNNNPQLKMRDSLTSKRAIMRNKHSNLMSLDENALYKLNRLSNLNSTIHESSVDAADVEIKEQKHEKKFSLFANTMPHSNFISLRSGSGSANSGCINHGRSYDNDNCDCNDGDSSLSLQQSQFLKPPSLNKLNSTILPTSQRPINPISSLRRHMFVNSKRSAQTTFDKYANDSIFTNELSVDFHNSMSIPSNNLSNIPSITDEIKHDLNTKTNIQDQKVEVLNECKDPNLLNPSWIPLIVRRTLLEMHERAVISKSDSNIKSKYRASNNLLHSSTSYKNNNSKQKVNRKKKSLSLQNSQDKSNLYSTSSSNNRSSGSSYLNNFYEELRQKFFQINSNETKNVNIEKNGHGNQTIMDKMKNSTSNSNTMSTDVSTIAFKPDSKLGSLDQQNPVNYVDTCIMLNENLNEENKFESIDKRT